MEMGMKQEVLSPGVKDAKEADLGSQILRVASHFAKCFGDSAEQKVVELGLILQDERLQFVGQREYHVEIARIEEFLLPSFNPAFTGLRLALVAMPVTAAVVGDGWISATLRTNIDMTAKLSSAASRDGSDCLELLNT
jgi:hypothetical protein